jgi:hypothetical protein
MPVLRRYLVFTIPALLFAGEFWQDKKPSDWTEKDVKRLLTKSPWAKEGTVAFNMERMGGMPGGGEPPMGGMPGGGGPPMGGGMGPGGGMGNGGMEMLKPVIRWESAAPLRDAAAKSAGDAAAQSFGEWSASFYVVTLSGFGAQGGRGGRGLGQPDPARLSQMQDAMTAATNLTIKGKPAIAAARVETVQTEQGQVTAFLFLRTAAIEVGDKEVTFETAMGPLGIKCKFVLKEMIYQGKLAL